MGLFGPGKADANHTRAAQTDRQRQARREDANASTRGSQVTVRDVQRMTGRGR